MPPLRGWNFLGLTRPIRLRSESGSGRSDKGAGCDIPTSRKGREKWGTLARGDLRS